MPLSQQSHGSTEEVARGSSVYRESGYGKRSKSPSPRAGRTVVEELVPSPLIVDNVDEPAVPVKVRVRRVLQRETRDRGRVLNAKPSETEWQNWKTRKPAGLGSHRACKSSQTGVGYLRHGESMMKVPRLSAHASPASLLLKPTRWATIQLITLPPTSEQTRQSDNNGGRKCPSPRGVGTAGNFGQVFVCVPERYSS